VLLPRHELGLCCVDGGVPGLSPRTRSVDTSHGEVEHRGGLIARPAMTEVCFEARNPPEPQQQRGDEGRVTTGLAMAD
jgi:hypothetical protein